MPCRSNETYVFIDGAYLRRIYHAAMQSVFACDGELDLPRIKEDALAGRAFIYDCLDDIRRANETDADYATRVTTQETLASTD